MRKRGGDSDSVCVFVLMMVDGLKREKRMDVPSCVWVVDGRQLWFQAGRCAVRGGSIFCSFPF